MFTVVLLLSGSVFAQAVDVEKPHRANDVYRLLLEEGLKIGGRRVVLPPPAINDEQTVEEQKKALSKVAGGDHAVGELLRDSITSPFVLKVKDEKDDAGNPIRRAGIWFTVHASLDAIDPESDSIRGASGKPFGAGNMRFTPQLLSTSDLTSRQIQAPSQPEAERLWYVHLSGRLLDRIEVEATDRVVASHSPKSWVIASKTDPKFDNDGTFPNRWHPILRKDGRDERGPAHTYGGGGSYVKISQFSPLPGVLLIESQFAFSEPEAWFDGAPILRSKLSVIVQDQTRRLRRELADAKRKAGSRPPDR
jgi:hypothetical protein